MCASKISRWLDVCLTKELVFFELNQIPKIWKDFLGKTATLSSQGLITEAFCFLRTIILLEYILHFQSTFPCSEFLLLGLAIVLLSPTLQGCSCLAARGRKGGNYCSSQRCFALIMILTLRSNGPPQCWPWESMHLPSVHSWRSRTSNLIQLLQVWVWWICFSLFFFFFSSCKYICFLREAVVIPYSRKGLKFLFIWLSKIRMSVHVQATFGAVRMASTTWPWLP